MSDPLKPSAALLVKLGSLIVHFEEAQSGKGHAVDRLVIDQLQADSDVRQWFMEMKALALLPVKR